MNSCLESDDAPEHFTSTMTLHDKYGGNENLRYFATLFSLRKAARQ